MRCRPPRQATAPANRTRKFFWDMHDWLFANQATWSEATDAADQFRKQALALGADGAKYDACLTDAATEARIQQDVQDGMTLGRAGHARLLCQRLVHQRRVSVR